MNFLTLHERNSMKRLEKSRIVGCCDEIIRAVDALGIAHKGKWPPILRKHYENAIRAAKLLKENATVANKKKEK